LNCMDVWMNEIGIVPADKRGCLFYIPFVVVVIFITSVAAT